jgi:tetratricopeptide (TPR) repeat protein
MPEGEIREAPAETPASRNGKSNGSDVTSWGKDRHDLDAAFDSDGLLSIERLRELEAVLVEQQRWSDLAELYALAAQRAPEGEAGRAMMLSAGLLTLEKQQDPRAAEVFLRRILASEPDNLEALEALRTIAINAARWEEAADLLDRLVSASPDEAKPELLFDLALVAYERLHQVERALVALRFAYELDPSRREVLSEARRIFIAEERYLDAKNVLDDEARIEGAENIAEAYRQLGITLLQSAQNHAIAEACLERARALGDGESLSKLDELAHIKKEWEAKAKALRDEALEARDKRKAAQLYLRAAELYSFYGKDPIRADEYLERCLLLFPGYAPALRFIEATHLEQGRGEDLVRKLNAMAGAVKDPSVKVEILLRVARLLEHAPNAEPQAIVNAYRRALALAPGHRVAVAQASHLLGSLNLNADRANILEAQLASVDDEYAKTEIHLELGRLYAEMLGDSNRARAHFEAVLAIQPTHFEAASALRALYKDAREQPLLLSVLKVLVEYTPDLFTRLELLHEIAAVAADVGREEVFAAYKRIFELDAEAKSVRKELEELAAALGRWQALADAYSAAAKKRSGTKAAELWIGAAQLYDGRLPRPTDAIDAYKRALAEITHHGAALDPQPVHDALERLLQQQNDPAALVEVLRSQLSRNTDPENEPLLLMKIGGVLDRELGDLDGAIKMFARVLERQPNNSSALLNLDDLYRRKEDWASLVGVLVRRETLADGASDMAELQCRRARVLDERLQQREEAADLYLDVLSTFPDQAEVVHALGKLLLEDVRKERIARALEPIFQQRGQFGRQLDMLSVLIESEQDPKQRRDLAKRAAQVAETRLGNLEIAFELAGEALKSDPSQEDCRDTFLRLAAATSEYKAAAAILEEALQRPDLQASTVSALAGALGDVFDGQLEDKNKAIDAYQRALHADGGNAMAVAALERLLGAQERWKELADLFSGQASRSAEKNAKVTLGLAIAAIRDQRLGDLDGAIDAYREVLSVEPAETTALGKLAEALERKERWRELVGVLDRMRDASSDLEMQAATDVKAGEVLHQRLKDRKAGIERYQRALSKRPGHLGAVKGLEALLEDLEMRPQAGALLEPYYAESERWTDLVIALESQLASAAEPERRRTLFLRIAEVERTKLGQADAAFQTLSRAFRENLIKKEERKQLEDAAVASRKARELAQMYEDALNPRAGHESIVAHAKDLELQRDLAHLYDGPAADPASARSAWERLLKDKPADTEALEALERLHASGDNPAALAEVLLQRAEVSTGEERVGFFRRASAIYEEAAEDLPHAIQAMERAAQEAGEDRGIYQELERLYGLAGEVVKLRDALEAQVRLVDEPLQRANLLVKLAEVSVKLELLDDSVAAYEAALISLPDHKEAKRGLETLLKGPAGPKAALALEPFYRSAADWSSLVEAYEILARASHDPTERVERLVAIRSLWEERLGRPDRAFAAAARAFRERPDSEELLASLERLARLSGQVEELLGLLEDRAEALPYVSKERTETRIRIARFTEALIHDRAQAIDAWRRVLEERPDNLPSLEALERLYSRSGDARELVEVLKTMAALVEDLPARTTHLRRAALILEEKLGERGPAAHSWELVLTLLPGDREALRRLDSIYTETRAFEELSLVLTEEIQIAERPEERGILYLRLGELRRKELQDPRGALTSFAAVLQEGEVAKRAYDAAVNHAFELVDHLKISNPELASLAAELVEPHFMKRGDHIRVVSAKEARIAAATDPMKRRALRFEISEVYERINQPEMAFLALARAYSETPNDAELAETLERLAQKADTEEELADIFAEGLPAIEDEKLALRLARKVAHIYDAGLDRGEAAVAYYNRVLALAPDDSAALVALERIHRRLGNAGELVDVYRGLLRITENTEQKKTLWKAIAQISEGELRDLDGAFEAYREMIALDGNDVAVLRGMAALCERSNRFQDLVFVLQREAELAARPDDKAQVLLRIAMLKKDRLTDPLGAVDAYKQVLEVRREDPGAIAGLGAIIREGGEARPKAAAALAPVYYQSGAFSDYIACLEAQVPSAKKSEKKGLLDQIAEVYEQRLGRPEHAFTYSCRALHEDLFDDAARARVERLANENQLHEDLAGFYLDEIDAVDDHELQLHLRRRVAEIYDRNVKDVTRAIAEYNKVLDVAPGDSEALMALERLYKQAGSFGSLAEVYRRRIAQTDDPVARAKLLREFARLQADSLKDAPGAIATLRRLLDIEPNDVPALERLARLCGDQGRASERADVLARLVQAAPEGSEIGLDARFELGKLKAEKLGDLGGAEQLFKEVLSLNPEHEKTRELLGERLENAVAEDDHSTAQATGEMLAEAMRKAGEHQNLISVLRMLSQGSASAFERVRLNREIADTYRQKLKNPELAFTTLAQVYKDAPGVEEVRFELEELAEELLMFDDLVAVLEAGLENIPDSELSMAVERKIAETLEQKINDRERASAAWQRVLSHLPMDPQALESMDRLNLALGRWAALTDVLEKRVELAEGQDDAMHELLIRAGAIWDERLSEKAEAIEYYRRARALKPRDKETLVALSRLLDPADADAAPELYAVLETLHDTAQHGKDAARLLPRMAALAGGTLAKGTLAIDLWRKVLLNEPNHPEALKQLETLLEAEARWEELAQHLERQLHSARDEKEVLRLQRKIGFVKGTRLGSIDEAVRSWSEILKRNPNDVEALMSLRNIYRDAKRYEDLVATLRKLIPLQLDAEGVKAVRFELAEVFLTNLNQREEAIESAKRVLDVEPHTEAELMRLEEIFVATGAFGEAVKVMNARVELADRNSEKIDILFDIATIYETRISRRAGAASAYEKVLSLEASSVKAYDALAAIYEGNGDYRKLVELHNRRLESTEDVAERRRLLFSIIDIQERWLGQPELAFTAACRAFAEEGADENAQNLAERLAEETGSWEILAEVFEEQVEQVGVNRGVDLRRRLGEIFLEKLNEPARAESQLEQVLSSKPEDEVARALLQRIYESQNRWRDLINLMHEQLEQSGIELKKGLYRRIADIEETKLKDVEAAISSTKRILDLDSEDHVALSELERMFRAAEKWHPLLGVLQRQLELAEANEERIKLRFGIAQVWDEGIEDSEHAIEAYRDVFTLDENHVASLRALERLYTQAERWIELIDIYERQVLLAENAGEAIQMLTRIAGIWEEEFRDLEGASATLIRVLEIDPEHLPTVKNLERVWKQSGDWERLIEATRRHIELIDDPKETVELYLTVGEIYVKELGKSEAAEDAYQSALELDPSSRSAIHALGQLYERAGNWFNALEMLQKEAVFASGQPEAVEIFYRMGKINEDMLMDRDAAKKAYNRAIDLEPSNALALRALRKILEDEGDYREVVNLQAQEARFSEDPQESAELFQHAAETCIDELDDNDSAVKLYEQSLSAKSDHVQSLRALGDLYFAGEEWEKAEKLLERLVDLLDRHDDIEELVKQNYRLAYIAEKLDDDHRALKRYLASYELDSTYLPTLEGLAAALLRAERWDDAQRIFQTILIHHKASLTDAEVVDLHFQLGELAVKLNQLERGKKSFDKALDLDTNHIPTLRAYANLAETLEQWEEAYDLRERLIVHLEAEEKLTELISQARLCRDKIQEPYRAIDAFCEARRIDADNPEILRSLVKLFEETSQAARTIETIEDLVRISNAPTEKRDLLYDLAHIQWDEQKNVQEAVNALNRALDLDPMFFKAFQKIEEILGSTKSWTALEENYHRMIQRMPKEQKAARIVLWTSLAELYQRVLKNDDGAKTSLEVVLKLNTEDYTVAMRLADLYGRRRDTAPKAIALYHQYLSQASDPAPPARRLYQLYAEFKQLDRAFCSLAALILMRAATEDEQKAYSMLLKRAPASAKRALTDNLWRTVVLDPACRTSLADISSVLYRGAPALFGNQQKALLLKKKERVELTDPKNPRVRLRYFDVWQRLANAMHAGEMDHYHRQGVSTAPRMYPGMPPALVVGEQHEAFKEMPPRQIAWILARQMASGRPEMALARSLGPDEVTAALEAAIRIYVPEGSGVDLNVDPRLIAEWSKLLRHELQERALKALRDPVVTCIERREMRHMRSFLEGTEHSASRAALLMAGDVAVAERGLSESEPLVDVSYRARVRSLILFTLSEDHFVLREKLGLAIA